jgi:hypothetical protein
MRTHWYRADQENRLAICSLALVGCEAIIETVVDRLGPVRVSLQQL